jgi:hypothetical protein
VDTYSLKGDVVSLSFKTESAVFISGQIYSVRFCQGISARWGYRYTGRQLGLESPT